MTAPALGRDQPNEPSRNRLGGAGLGDDEWLDALDSSVGETNVALPRGAKARPKVPARKKGKMKRRPRTPPKEHWLSRFVDEDGELPLSIHWMLMIVTGLCGGALGMGIWAAMIYFTEYEVGYVAILVGFLVGTGVRIGASKWDYGWGPALSGVAITIPSIIAGRILGVYLLFGGLGNFGLTVIAVLISVMMSPIDLLWFFLGGAAAFKIGAGMVDDDD